MAHPCWTSASASPTPSPCPHRPPCGLGHGWRWRWVLWLGILWRCPLLRGLPLPAEHPWPLGLTHTLLPRAVPPCAAALTREVRARGATSPFLAPLPHCSTHSPLLPFFPPAVAVAAVAAPRASRSAATLGPWPCTRSPLLRAVPLRAAALPRGVWAMGASCTPPAPPASHPSSPVRSCTCTWAAPRRAALPAPCPLARAGGGSSRPLAFEVHPLPRERACPVRPLSQGKWGPGCCASCLHPAISSLLLSLLWLHPPAPSRCLPCQLARCCAVVEPSAPCGHASLLPESGMPQLPLSQGKWGPRRGACCTPPAVARQPRPPFVFCPPAALPFRLLLSALALAWWRLWRPHWRSCGRPFWSCLLGGSSRCGWCSGGSGGGGALQGCSLLGVGDRRWALRQRGEGFLPRFTSPPSPGRVSGRSFVNGAWFVGWLVGGSSWFVSSSSSAGPAFRAPVCRGSGWGLGLLRPSVTPTSQKKKRYRRSFCFTRRRYRQTEGGQAPNQTF